MRNGFNPRGVWGPRGRGFSMGAIQRAGRVVHQVPGTQYLIVSQPKAAMSSL